MPSLLFIPDISGFTKFVNAIEIDHSQHIIAELLELIIDSDELGLTVAEVEGDAILFHSEGEAPDANAILQQCRNTFVRFHEHLRAYDGQRICECGACRTAIDLTLKFVAHPADFTMMRVKNNAKPYGPEVILAHRLLKNNVQSDEYVIWTDVDAPLELAAGMSSTGMESSTYEDAGEVSYQVVELGGLHEQVKNPPPPEVGPLIADPVTYSVHLDQDRITVMAKLLDLNERPIWLKGLKSMEHDSTKLNRNGMSHRCVLENGISVNDTVVRPDSTPKRIIVGEQPRDLPFIKEAAIYFIPEERDKGTLLTAEAHFIPKGLIGKLMTPLFRKKLRGVVRDTLEDFQIYMAQQVS